MANMEKAVEGQLLAATNLIEKQIDSQLESLDRALNDEDELESLRRRRMEAMKSAQKQRQDWLANGHGTYEEIADESAFFAACKKSQNVVCHFFCSSTPRCKIVDKHLTILASRHIEARFIRIDAERSKFLVDRLRIKVMPTICLAKNGKTVDYVAGFDDLGGVDDFTTEMLEWRIARAGVLEYAGDLLNPPTAAAANKISILGRGGNKKKTIRDGAANDSSDDDD
jgi:thioredoxin-like negative regulator of GroEL